MLCFVILFTSCGKDDSPTEPEDGDNTVTDIDGNVYQIVQIGNQCWMAANLKVTHYRNSEAIPNETDNSAWTSLTTGAYYSYDNDENNIETYGRLYNWHAVKDNRNIAPKGWHVPSDDEWKELELYLGMSQEEVEKLNALRGTDKGGKLKETETQHWDSPNVDASNESDFSALPAGYRYSASGLYIGIGALAYFGTATDSPGRILNCGNSQLGRHNYVKESGFSVRCVKD